MKCWAPGEQPQRRPDPRSRIDPVCSFGPAQPPPHAILEPHLCRVQANLAGTRGSLLTIVNGGLAPPRPNQRHTLPAPTRSRTWTNIQSTYRYPPWVLPTYPMHPPWVLPILWGSHVGPASAPPLPGGTCSPSCSSAAWRSTFRTRARPGGRGQRCDVVRSPA